MESIIKKAKESGHPVVLMYLSKKGLVTKRMVTIEGYSEQWMQGYCHLRKSFRRFQRENILAILPASYNERKTQIQ
ncbi:hypothetical protein ACERII_08185 [Evansella sp. AB-rgal1]|uniref:hypothetical protein n=1 Tax=Evansella sp. AB-rgal1 TaxID=3242696 RepID=UPI00359E3E5A